MSARKGATGRLLAVLLMPVLAFGASAQDYSSLGIGTFHSPKGLGVCMELQADKSMFDSFDIIADMYGVLTGQYSTPGIKATYCRNIILKHIDREDCALDLYAGPGVTAGYVRDIHEPYSLVAGMAGSAGCRMDFYKKNIIIYMELGVDLAGEFNRDNRFKTLNLNIYKSGIYHIFYPQVRILYRL